jgi:hypothetical protein
MLTIQSQGGASICTLEDWHTYAPPKRPELHWKDGRSAKELARAWCGSGSPAYPQDLAELLDAHPTTVGFSPELGIPELVTRLDDFRGEARNQDLVMIGTCDTRRVLLGIEAKADEPLGARLSEIRSDNLRSKRQMRLDLLARAIVGRPVDSMLAHLRYQLLTGIAGTLIEAKRRQAAAAVFLIHVFHAPSLSPIREAQNATAVADLLAVLGVAPAARTARGWLTDPFTVPGGLFVPGDLPIMLGTLTTAVTLRNEDT